MVGWFSRTNGVAFSLNVALEDFATTLARPVRFHGDLGELTGWPVETGLYRAIAAVLGVLAEESAVAVDFSRDDALRVLITAPAGRLTAPDLRTALDPSAARLAVLGGAMTYAVTCGAAVVSIRLGLDGNVPLYSRVCDLVRQGQRTAGDGPDRPRWDAVAERLTMPARVAVVREPVADPAEPVPGITIVDAEAPADHTLAEEFLSDDGPRGSVDAVLCLVPPTPAFRATLRWGRQRVAVSESANLASLTHTVTAWAPVIAARRAAVSARELAAALPADDPLRWAIDRIGADTHEFAELDLLDDLERADTRLLRSAGKTATTDAARLLGAHGTDPHTRLDLPTDATADQLLAAADEAVRRWRTHAERPATGGRDRAACEVLARTAEGLLDTEQTR